MRSNGPDVSLFGKSMLAVMCPFGEVVTKPFEIHHTASELKGPVDYLKSLNCEVWGALEYTGRYYQSIARYLRNMGIFVKDMSTNTLIQCHQNALRYFGEFPEKILYDNSRKPGTDLIEAGSGRFFI